MSKKTFSHFKLQGEWAELLFMARASELGLTLVRPWGDSLPFDVALIVDNHAQRARKKPCGCPIPGSPTRSVLARRGGVLPASFAGGWGFYKPDLLRIQIKSTRCLHSDGAYKCHIDSNGTPYTLHQLDFIAAYVIPAKVWYIIPLAATRGQTEVLLAPNRPHSKYAQFKEAWHLLRNGNE